MMRINFGQRLGRALGDEEVIYLADISWVLADRYVLTNCDICDIVEAYRW